MWSPLWLLWMGFSAVAHSHTTVVDPRCPPGTYLEKDYKCHSCKEGTYNDVYGTNTKCIPCDRYCPVGLVPVSPCNGTQNLKCSCPPGQFDKNVESNMRLHSQPHGYYSVCVNHTDCQPNQIVIQQGNDVQDTQCGDGPSKDKNGIQGNIKGNAAQKIEHKLPWYIILIVILVILFLIIVGLVIYICWDRRQRNMKKKRQEDNDSLSSESELNTYLDEKDIDDGISTGNEVDTGPL